MKKLVIALAFAIGVAGCSSLPTLNIGNQVNLNTIEGVVSGYGILLNAENTYKALPLCKTGTTPSITNVCAKRSIIVRLQSADKIANTAVNTAVSFVKSNPSVDPSQYLTAAQNALTALQTVLNTAQATGS
jgi:hypothetical protein